VASPNPVPPEIDPPEFEPTVLQVTMKFDMADMRSVATATARRERMAPMPYGYSDEVGALLAEICRGWIEMLDHSASRPAPPSPIEISPDVAALLDRLSRRADWHYVEDGIDRRVRQFDPEHADDLRRAVELIRFGRRATGQPDAGNMEDDSR
jgi:hypothetical protein